MDNIPTGHFDNEGDTWRVAYTITPTRIRQSLRKQEIGVDSVLIAHRVPGAGAATTVAVQLWGVNRRNCRVNGPAGGRPRPGPGRKFFRPQSAYFDPAD